MTLPEPLRTELCGIDRIHLERSASRAPLRLVPCELRVSVTFADMGGYELVGEPLGEKESNRCGMVTAVTERPREAAGAKVTLERRLVVERDFIPRDAYGDLRSLLMHYHGGRVALEKRVAE
jgi:hypothetical protein